MGHHGASQEEGARKGLIGLELAWVISGGFKEAGLCFGLDAVRKQGNSMIEYLIKQILSIRRTEWSGANAVTGKEACSLSD